MFHGYEIPSQPCKGILYTAMPASRCTLLPKEEKSFLIAVRAGSLTSSAVSCEFHSDLHELACMYSARALSFEELLAALFC